VAGIIVVKKEGIVDVLMVARVDLVVFVIGNNLVIKVDLIVDVDLVDCEIGNCSLIEAVMSGFALVVNVPVEDGLVFEVLDFVVKVVDEPEETVNFVLRGVVVELAMTLCNVPRKVVA
jgi:hypothetical protein